MRRWMVLLVVALLVTAGVFAMTSGRAPAQSDYADRIASLETRVAALETVVAGDAAENDSTATETASESDAATAIDVSGNGSQLTGPYSLAPGRYRVSFLCNESAGFSILTAENGSQIGQESQNSTVGEQIFTVNNPQEGLYLDVNCDADWTYTVVPI